MKADRKISFGQIAFTFLLNILAVSVNAQSGGTLSLLQSSYDVKYYSLDLTINSGTKTINGSLLCMAEIINPINTFVLDLDKVFTIDSVLYKKEGEEFTVASFNHNESKINISIPETVVNGDNIFVQVFYSGFPKIAERPPWDDGFVWGKTPSGDQWIGVACETSGADIWWPCKDHPSDEPDSMSLSFTVTNPFTCVSNGKFIGSVDNGDNTSTYKWFVSTPINNYNVTFYAAEFNLIEDDYISISGETIPFYFWVLPDDYWSAYNHMDVFKQEFDFLETICGPFPFGTDKHGWAHAPYWGMEHQTIIAYGHDFSLNSWGFDYIHYHELAHEWWGNFITAKDWSDVWIHEGIATYTEALYVEHLRGMDGYFKYMNSIRPINNHTHPLAPIVEITSSEAFNNLNPYYRGASVMHTLRYHLGDESFFNLLKRWVYPNSLDFDNTNGRQCRILSTNDMKEKAEEITGVNLDPFFEVFFREASYPNLIVDRKTDSTVFIWETENSIKLDLDIPVFVNGIEQRVDVKEGIGVLYISANDILDIDPNKWILMDSPEITNLENNFSVVGNYKLQQNYPNPFEYSTTIEFTILKREFVTIKVLTSNGVEVKVLVHEELLPGNYKVILDREKLSSGIYFYNMQTPNFNEIKSLIIK